MDIGQTVSFRRMAAPKPRSSSGRSTPLRDSSESEKMEATGSWDALDWTIEPVSRSVSQSVSRVQLECLLEAEQVEVEGYGVVLVNTDEAGCKESITPRQSDKTPSRRLLQVIGKDMRIIVFGFRPKTRQRRAVFNALLKCTKPANLWDLYAFVSGPSKFNNTNPKVRLLNEYLRLLGKGSLRASMNMIEDGSFTFSNDLWRISSINSSYTMCQSYPFALIVPKSITDDEVLQASNFRARGRLPVVTWCHPKTGAVLARSSQPLVGIMMNMRSNTDEKIVAALCAQLTGTRGKRRKLYIADARPRKNALANGAMGDSFLWDRQHTRNEREFCPLRDYLDTHGAASSDGMSSFLRHGGWTWGGGNLSSMSASVSTLGDSGWLIHVQSVLAGSAWIAARVALESASVLVHCSDGWDRTTQLISLANLLLDPYYRTVTGFQALIEKDWLAFGHPFADRVGMSTVTGSCSIPSELPRQSSTGSIQSSPMRQPSASFTSQPPTSHAQNNYSPIFLQWVDCVSQLLRMYPFAFEFSSAFLVDLVDCVLSCRFGNFFCNSEKERQQCGVPEACGCMWAYLADLRASKGSSHVHYNYFYDPLKHDGPILPPAAALAPTLWPQFHLRWACPAEAQAGDVEAQFRKMDIKFSELQKEKEAAERKAKEITAVMELLSADLQNEKQVSSSAMILAKRASKESEAIKRAIQSLGCNVHFSSSGDCTVDIESSQIEPPLKSSYPSKREADGAVQRDDKSDLSVSITVMADDLVSSNPIDRVCETLCPLRMRDGGCRWPDAGCAQLGSQFVGLKANYEAFDKLSIYDSYFQPK
ncbi:Myotubularin-like phosphatases II superfamily [Prunus dulcis]|uniref:Myotubularin-like phosphatases II superfamily n=1 Tax=Prunus dulcis TaxID=3755 RepID=A0A4Y1QYV7_PRUDU|nr:Myotubularin-like phosphatases II superfamily [Prunus dulcis]